VGKNAIWILDTNAKVLAKFAAPNSGDLGEGRAVLIKKDNNHKLATIVDFGTWHRSILYLHDLTGDLLYQEVLPESCPTITELLADKPNSKLLIGCEGKVIEYQIK
jgi:hypothetical protein